MPEEGPNNSYAPNEKLKKLPVEIRQCGIAINNPKVITVNGQLIDDPIELEVVKSVFREHCTTAETQLNFKKLVKQFQLGINRFEVESAGQTTEIVFQAEL